MSDNDRGTYIMPYNNDEYNRLNIQHVLWTVFFGGLFPAKLTPIVERRMASSRPMVMDVGCGTGIWAIEMAIRFPQAEVIGIDIVIPSIPGPVPSNLSFKQLDLAKGIPDEYTGRSDIMHCRLVVQHMQDPHKLVNDLVRCLKPGGLVIIPEAVLEVLDEDRKPLTPFFYNPEIDVGENIMNARKLSGFGGYLAFIDKRMRSPKYREASVVLKSTGAVGKIWYEEFLAPVGWAGKNIPRGQEIGALLRTTMKDVFETTSKILIGHGVPVVVVDAMKERAIAELEERTYLVWNCASAIAVDEPASKL